jgi:hypothetical protein
MPLDRDTKVVGYFAFASPTQVVCSGAACVIAGSESSMREFLSELSPGAPPTHTIRKTRFSEIVVGMNHGALYAFDRESFSRFYPLALEAGMPVANPDFDAARARGERFLILQPLA